MNLIVVSYVSIGAANPTRKKTFLRFRKLSKNQSVLGPGAVSIKSFMTFDIALESLFLERWHGVALCNQTVEALWAQ